MRTGGTVCPAVERGTVMIGSQDLLAPELSRSLGQAMAEFKKGVTGATSETKAPVDGLSATSEPTAGKDHEDPRS